MGADFSYQIWHAKMFLLKISLSGCPGEKDSFTIRKNFFPTLVATFLLKGGLYHVVFQRLVLSSLRVWSLVVASNFNWSLQPLFSHAC